jgi:protein translocase SecG subunit
MIQPSKGEGLGSIGGGSQMFFGKNKGLEVLLEKVTAGLAVAFFLLAIIANLV